MSFNGDCVLTEKERPRVVLLALCYSERCTFNAALIGMRGQSRYGVNPKHKPHAKGAWCPDCGHALVWERKPLEALQKQVIHKVKRSKQDA